MTQLKGDLNQFINYFNYLFNFSCFPLNLQKISLQRGKNIWKGQKRYFDQVSGACITQKLGKIHNRKKRLVNLRHAAFRTHAHYRMTSHYLSRNKAKLKYHFKVGFYGWLSVAISSRIENRKSWKKMKKIGGCWHWVKIHAETRGMYVRSRLLRLVCACTCM